MGLIFTLLAGCASNDPEARKRRAERLVWSNYTDTLYEYYKSPNKKTYRRYKLRLEALVEGDRKQSFSAPPGIHAELGKLYLDEGNKALALQMFQREVQKYPESAEFMKFLINKAQ